MNSESILEIGIRPAPNSVFLSRLIEFFGLMCRSVEPSTIDAELDRAADHALCVLASAAAIHDWLRNLADPTIALGKLCQKASALFVYGFAPETPAYIAAALSDYAIVNVRRFTRTDLRYEVSSSQPEITREFSGLSFTGVRNATDFGFKCSENSREMASLVTIEGMPFWVLVQKNGCQVFLLACGAIGDIQEPVKGNIDATSYFSRLLPPAMFLRSSFKSQCWHSNQRLANFIFDDPPLKPSYGFLNYEGLVSTMDKTGFATTIAFIPWNYKRTDSDVSQLFHFRPDRLSLCVHGCDHIRSEFATSKLAVLNSRVRLASARMDSLQRQNGLTYSKTMVFPQGRFSTAALTTLKSNNYLAAVNSSALAVNSNRSLTVADFLEPAVTSYAGFPLFLRRYPAALEQFAFDLFFGKPILVVEHHGYLRDGGVRLAAFIEQLNSLERLEWRGLDEILTRSYLERDLSSEIAACKLYTNQQIIHNHAERERTFILTKCETDDVPIQDVLVDGQATGYKLNGNLLQLIIQIPALASKEVKIGYRNTLPDRAVRRAVASWSRIWTRRMLSEFRDNVLSRSELLLAGAQVLHRGLSSRHKVKVARRDRVSAQHQP